LPGALPPWIITLPAGAGLAIIFFFLFKGIFNP
jgi:PiT family inorganic phosphate transporter